MPNDVLPGTPAPGSRDAPIVRYSGRVLLIDARGRLLLWRVTEIRDPRTPFWLTPGGGLEPGEDSASAALRELEEETGLRGVPLGPHVWRRTYLHLDGALWRESREDYFLVRVPSHEVNTAGHTDLERRELTGHRWWSLAEIEAARDEVFVPHALATLLAPLLRGDLPPTPIEVGA